MITSSDIRTLLLVLFAFIYAGCAAPKITNHSKGKFEYRVVNPVNFIDVSVTLLHAVKTEVIPKPQLMEKTFFDLRDSIPQTFLKVIGNKATSVDEIIKAIRTPLSAPYPNQMVNHQKVIDQRFLTTKLLFSNIKKYYVTPDFMHPNTRLEFLNIKIKLDTQSIVKIVSVDRMENEFEIVDLGTLKNTSEGVFKAGLSGNLGYTGNKELNYGQTDNTGNIVSDGTSNSLYDDAGNMVGTGQFSNNNTQGTTRNSSGKEAVELGAGAKADIGYELKNSLSESVAIKQRRLKTGISFDTAQLTISQRGSPLVDISDNVVVTVTLQVSDSFIQRNSYEFLYLFDEKLKQYPADSARLIRKLYKYYPCDTKTWNVGYDVDFEGALRTVENKSTGRNMLEFDDKVIYNVFYDTLSNSSIPLNKYEFCRNVYNINVQLGATRYPLRIDNFVFDERFLIHEDDKPYLFVQWFMQLLVANNGALHNNPNFEIYFMNGTNKVYLLKRGGLTSAELFAIKDIEFSLLKE